MIYKFIVRCFIVLIGMFYLFACSRPSDENTKLIGHWKTDAFHSPDLGIIVYEITFKKNKCFESLITLDTGDIMGFSGDFSFRDNILSLHMNLGFGIEDGKKTNREEIDIVEEYIASFPTPNELELKESDSNSKKIYLDMKRTQ